MHLGKKLEEYIQVNRIPVAHIAAKTGSSRQTVYNWMQYEEFDNKIYTLLKLAGITKEDLQSQKSQIEKPKEQMIETLVKTLSRQGETLQAAVDALSEDNKHLRKENSHANELIRDYLKLNNAKAKTA